MNAAMCRVKKYQQWLVSVQQTLDGRTLDMQEDLNLQMQSCNYPHCHLADS